MLKSDYIARGYRLSANIDQSQIDKAERDIKSAYILPLFVEAPDFTFEPFLSCVMELSFIYIMKSRATATRSGGVNKERVHSNADIDLSQNYAVADMLLQAVRRLSTSEGHTSDVCGIYFVNKIRF